jgi:hypothetical protein
VTIGLRFRRYRLARDAAVASLGRGPSPFAGEGRNSATLVVSLMLRLVILLHEQMVAGVQGAAAGNHQDRHFCSPFAIGDDRGLVVLARAAKNYDELGFGSGSGGHLCVPPVTAAEHDGMAKRGNDREHGLGRKNGLKVPWIENAKEGPDGDRRGSVIEGVHYTGTTPHKSPLLSRRQLVALTAHSPVPARTVTGCRRLSSRNTAPARTVIDSRQLVALVA